MQPRTSIIAGFVLLLAGMGALSYAAVEPAPSIRQMDQGIPYISGGVGLDERQVLQRTAKAYDLKLVFALREGNYLSDVEVLIEDNTGREVLTALSQGPWFFAQLPAGHYRITAQVEGKSIQKTVRVSPRTQTQILFSW